MTIATVERVILGPVMLVPHEAGYVIPLSMMAFLMQVVAGVYAVCAGVRVIGLCTGVWAMMLVYCLWLVDHVIW